MAGSERPAGTTPNGPIRLSAAAQFRKSLEDCNRHVAHEPASRRRVRNWLKQHCERWPRTPALAWLFAGQGP